MSSELPDLDLIRQTVQDYFEGMYHSDVERLKAAFHPSAFLMGYFQGNFAQISLKDWLGMIGKTPAPSEGGEAFD